MTILKKGIIFGPWVGEFGWELFAWHAHCRTIARSCDYCVVISRPGNRYLYSDFCDLFLGFEPPPEGVSDSHMNSAVTDFNLQEFVKACMPDDTLQSHDWSWIMPQKIGHPPYDHWRTTVPIHGAGDITPQYRLLRGDIGSNEKVDVVIHARNREIREVDNWSVERWNDVVQALSKELSFACIGKSGSAAHILGTEDYRNKNLEFVSGLLNSAKCVAGPSSGPLHLATLSGCPQVWWTSNPNQNFSRYKYTWNPFGIDSLMLSDANPSSEDVVNGIVKVCGVQ